MAAANGFVTVSPDARYGDEYGFFVASEMWAVKFTAPESGTLAIAEIGLWSYAAGAGDHARLGIFTHDAGNDCPEALVSDSFTDTLNIPESVGKVNHIYSPKPEITGGTIYWLCVMQDDQQYYSRFAAGGAGLYVTGRTYGTWPTPTEWETHTDWNKDFSVYAVYEGGGGIVVLRRRRM